jgi:hypothetical protein
MFDITSKLNLASRAASQIGHDLISFIINLRHRVIEEVATVHQFGCNSLNATNADLTLGEVMLGSNGLSSGYVNQDSSSIAAQSIDVVQAAYRMQLGVIYSLDRTMCSGGPFTQLGGTNHGNITLTGDYYGLESGMVQGIEPVAEFGQLPQPAGSIWQPILIYKASTSCADLPVREMPPSTFQALFSCLFTLRSVLRLLTCFSLRHCVRFFKAHVFCW